MELTTYEVIMTATPLVLLLVEYYLGKSEVPKANSIIEFLLGMLTVFKK